ncbi:MAG: hypothetical protein EA417_21300 [Gammaproteobacteria bacterium]|nr:MAG: hypothetical protein EA417_21300 [Gammaproteobacteria bacterium]
MQQRPYVLEFADPVRVVAAALQLERNQTLRTDDAQVTERRAAPINAAGGSHSDGALTDWAS